MGYLILRARHRAADDSVTFSKRQGGFSDLRLQPLEPSNHHIARHVHVPVRAEHPDLDPALGGVGMALGAVAAFQHVDLEHRAGA